MMKEILMNQGNRLRFSVNRAVNNLCNELVDTAVEKGKNALKEHFGTSVVLYAEQKNYYVALRYIYGLDKEKYKKHAYGNTGYNRSYIWAPHELKMGAEYFINLDGSLLFIKVIRQREFDKYSAIDESEGSPITLYLYFFGKNAYHECKKMNGYITNGVEKLNRLAAKKTSSFSHTISTFTVDNDFKCVPNEPIETIKMSDVIMDEKTKTDLMDYINTWSKSENEFKEYGLSFNLGILLYGKPGTGKTSLIKLIASQTDYAIVNINLSNIQRSIQSLKKIELQSRFVPYSPAINLNKRLIIVMEDFDFIFGNREELVDKEDKKNVNDLLQLLDGFNSIGSEIIFIATTNRLETLDEAIIREGRFDIKIEMTEFDKENAIKMCKKFKVDESVLEGESYPINPAYLQSKILKKKMDDIRKSSDLLNTK